MPNTDLPEEPFIPAEDTAQDEPKLDRRTAIAQARAIRREAAAMDESVKAQAAETANIILEQAEPEPPKAPLHKQTEPVPVSNTTGKFGWLDEVKKSESERVSSEELVARVLAETESRESRDTELDADAAIEKIVAETVSADSPEAIVAQVLAETAPAAAVTEPDTDGSGEHAPAESEEAPAEPAPPDNAPVPEPPAADPVEASAAPEPDLTEAPAAANDAAALPEEPEVTPEPTLPEPPESPEQEPEAQSDTPVQTLPRYLLPPAMSAREAAEQYRTLTAEAKPQIRKLAKKAERAWRREAGSIRAQNTEQRTARTAAIWNIAVCLILLFGIAVGMLVLERPTVSMKENRTLAQMPEWSVESYLSGKFTNGVAEYYNDTVPFRDNFKEMTQILRKHMGLSGSAVIHGNVPAVQQGTEPAETTAPVVTTAQTVTEAALTTVAAETTALPDEPDEPEREGELSNNILIVDKRGIMLFGGWETMGQNYARILNRYKETMPDVDMYSMVVPTVCSYYTPEEFQYLITSEKANIDYINQSLVGVTPVDVYGALAKHTDEPIFMRTDHHWSGLGAFYAAEEFSADARVPFARIEEYDKHTKDDYVGTLYGYSNDIILKENPEEFFWYVPHAQFRTTFYSNSFTNGYEANFFMNMENVAPVSYYMVYMTGDDHIVRLETEMHNGRKLCVIKDSYGNALIPWLTSSFEEIYVVDMRYFKLNFVNFARQQGITDILFAMNTFSANGDNAQKMETILTQ